ncbi:efflux RND transporter periplasmic adaptor subunit [Roseimaritima sediminicola]|uniref:efflux RND transporter periplasmic adaptor subunit n=1 Tax=Roseimaritima sediminicola TaxID=2662066 RepID=UPI0013869B8B|nr:efflux RND transporter periplasmic adaptor subunit [Roseimaritima sediminicola]
MVGCKSDSPTPATGAAGPPPAPPVRVAKPVTETVVEWAEFTGRLQAVDFVEVRSRVSGYLQSVEFEEGQLVEEGDLLFVIDPRPFEAAKAIAEAKLEEAKARQQQSQAQLETAQADRLVAESNLEFAKSELDRMTQLQRQNAVSKSDFDRARNEHLKAKAQLQSAVAAISAAQAAIATAKASIVTGEAALDEAELDLQYTRIVAPVEGRIGRINITEGNLVSGGNEQSMVLSTIVSLDPMYFVFDASEQQVLRFRRLMQAGKRQSAREVRYPVYLQLADEQGYPHQGYLDFVDNRFDPQTATMTARAVFDNQNAMLSAGMFGKIRLAETPPFEALLLPDEVIRADQSQQAVFVVDQQNVVHSRLVQTGSRALGLRIVYDGVSAEDRVVMGSLQQVREGLEIDPQPVDIEVDRSQMNVREAEPAVPAEADSTESGPSESGSPESGSPESGPPEAGSTETAASEAAS